MNLWKISILKNCLKHLKELGPKRPKFYLPLLKRKKKCLGVKDSAFRLFHKAVTLPLDCGRGSATDWQAGVCLSDADLCFHALLGGKRGSVTKDRTQKLEGKEKGQEMRKQEEKGSHRKSWKLLLSCVPPPECLPLLSARTGGKQKKKTEEECKKRRRDNEGAQPLALKPNTEEFQDFGSLEHTHKNKITAFLVVTQISTPFKKGTIEGSQRI